MNIPRRQFMKSVALAGAAMSLPNILQALGEKPSTSEPPLNVLVLFPDQWRWDWLGLLGKLHVRTPNLDRLAASGVLFTQCRSNSPVCAPARACLTTAMRFRGAGVSGNGKNLDPALPNCWQHLRQAGWRVATCGKNDLHKADGDWGTSGNPPILEKFGFTDAIEHAGKGDAYKKLKRDTPCFYGDHLRKKNLAQVHIDDMDKRTAIGEHRAIEPSPLPRPDYTDDVCGENALELLRRIPTSQPWALWVNFPGPHTPFDPPRELQSRYDDTDFPQPVSPNTEESQSAASHLAIRRNYAAMIEGIDEWCGRILEEIEKRGETGRTLVIFSSDHGDMLGDHKEWNKNRPQEGSVHVPLIVAGPGIAGGRTSPALVELCDLGSTIADASRVPLPASWHGRSLLPLLAGKISDADFRSHQIMEINNAAQKLEWEAACDGRYKVIRHFNGKPSECYDLEADLGETQNIPVPVAAKHLVQALDTDTER